MNNAVTLNKLHQLIEISTRAISAYNCQPWRFRIERDEIHIFILRTKNYFLKLEGVSYIELGAVIENMLVACEALGIMAEPIYLRPDLGLDSAAAAYRLSESSTEPRLQDLAPILNRCSNRSNYERRPLAETLLSEIAERTSSANIKLEFCSGERLKEVASILSALEELRLGNFRLVQEALRYVRFSLAEVETYRDMHDFRNIPVNFLSKSLVPKLYKSNLVFSILCRLGLPRRVSQQLIKGVSESGTLILYTLENRNYEDYVELGRLVQRTLNSISAHGGASMPIISGIYLFDVLKENEEIFSAKELTTLRHLESELKATLNLGTRRLSFVVRAGYSANPTPRSLRKRVKDLMHP